MSRPLPVSQNRWRTPLHRWYISENVAATSSTWPTTEPKKAVKRA